MLFQFDELVWYNLDSDNQSQESVVRKSRNGST